MTKESRKWDWKHLIVITILINSIIRFILAWLSRPSGDSCRHLVTARMIDMVNTIPSHISIYFDNWVQPLPHIFMVVFNKMFSIFGAAAGAKSMEFVSWFCGTLNLILLYYIMKKMLALDGRQHETRRMRTIFFTILFFAFIPVNFYMGYISHVESMAVLFVLIPVLLALHNRYILSSLVLAAGGLVKLFTPVIIPILFIIYWKVNKKFSAAVKRTLFCGITYLALGFLWNVRNYITYGYSTYPTPDMGMKLFNPLLLIGRHLADTFGVPNGDYTLFHLFGQYATIALALFFIAGLIFMIPFFKALFDKYFWNLSSAQIMIMWILLYSAFGIFLVLCRQPHRIFVRYLLPMFPAIAYLWAVGYMKISDKLKRTKLLPILSIVLIVFLVGFTLGEVGKTVYGAKQWEDYASDYTWVEENIPEDARIFVVNTYFNFCHEYATNRPFISYDFIEEEISKNGFSGIYIWDKTDEQVRSQNKEDYNRESPPYDMEKVYFNEATNVAIYRINGRA